MPSFWNKSLNLELQRADTKPFSYQKTDKRKDSKEINISVTSIMYQYLWCCHRFYNVWISQKSRYLENKTFFLWINIHWSSIFSLTYLHTNPRNFVKVYTLIYIYIRFFISNTFISNTRLTLSKNKQKLSNILRLTFDKHVQKRSLFVSVRLYD